MPWTTWDEVPEEPDLSRSWFLESFAGTAGVTRAILAEANLWCLPPIEIEPNNFVPQPVAIFSRPVQAKAMRWLQSGAVVGHHMGTPCSSFTRARRNDGGPPPIRDNDHLDGLPGLTDADQAKVNLGNQCLQVSAKLADSAHPDTVSTVENPLNSMLCG